MSQLFASGGQSIGASASESVLPMNILGWFPLRLSGLISLLSKRLFKSLLQHHNWKASILHCSAFFMVQLSNPYMTTGKTITLTRWTFVGKMMPLLFNTLSRFFIAFLQRNKHFLIMVQSPSAVILEPEKIESATVPIFSWSISHEMMRLYAMILLFGMLSFKPTLSLSPLTLIKRLFSSSLLSAIRMAQFSSVQSLSLIQLFVTPWTAALQASLSIINSWSLLKLIPLSWWCYPTI